MVPGPVLSKSVKNELLPVSTRPPPGLLVLPPGFRSVGNALVMLLFGSSSSSRLRRGRGEVKAPGGRRGRVGGLRVRRTGRGLRGVGGRNLRGLRRRSLGRLDRGGRRGRLRGFR